MTGFPVVVTLVVLTLATFSGCTKPKGESKMELPTSPSEDMSHLLIKPASAAEEFNFDEVRDYLPDPNIEWVVTFDFEESIARNRIENILTIPWLNEHGRPTIYGFSPDEKHWTYVRAKDSPERFSSLKIAWSLWNALDEKPRNLSLGDLDGFKTAAQKQLSSLGKFTMKIDRPGKDVLAFVAGLPVFVAECDKDVTLILVADEGAKFSGRDVWDVMLSLGLEYGDGDLFHWINNSGFGNDHFFTVETSTPPGYFIPRRMASSEGDVTDLIFNFSAPRSADPLVVFDSMVRAVEYAQKRLGGKILLQSGVAFDKEAERAKIESIVKKLKAAGFVPGESATCRVF